jgi:hypothetical protein
MNKSAFRMEAPQARPGGSNVQAAKGARKFLE